MAWTWMPNNALAKKHQMVMDRINCPYMLCPSNQPFSGAHPTKLKFIQKLAPTVFQYRCKYCGCLLNYGAEGYDLDDPRRAEIFNPAFISGKPSYNFQW